MFDRRQIRTLYGYSSELPSMPPLSAALRGEQVINIRFFSWAEDLLEALARGYEEDPHALHLVVAEKWVPHMTGVTLLLEVRRRFRGKRIACVLLTDEVPDHLKTLCEEAVIATLDPAKLPDMLFASFFDRLLRQLNV